MREGWRETVKRVPSIDRGLRSLRRTDEIASLQRELEQERQRVAELQEAARPGGLRSDLEPVVLLTRALAPFLEWRPPGHYYSPIPSMREIVAQEDRIFDRPDDLVGLDLNGDAQRALFETLAPLINEVAFNGDPKPEQPILHQQPVLRPSATALSWRPAPPLPPEALPRSRFGLDHGAGAGHERALARREDCASRALSRTPTTSAGSC